MVTFIHKYWGNNNYNSVAHAPYMDVGQEEEANNNMCVGAVVDQESSE